MFFSKLTDSAAVKIKTNVQNCALSKTEAISSICSKQMFPWKWKNKIFSLWLLLFLFWSGTQYYWVEKQRYQIIVISWTFLTLFATFPGNSQIRKSCRSNELYFRKFSQLMSTLAPCSKKSHWNEHPVELRQ